MKVDLAKKKSLKFTDNLLTDSRCSLLVVAHPVKFTFPKYVLHELFALARSRLPLPFSAPLRSPNIDAEVELRVCDAV